MTFGFQRQLGGANARLAMNRLAGLALLWMLASVGPWALAEEGGTPASSTLESKAHTEEGGVRREFESICKSLKASRNPYFGEAVAGDLRRQLATGSLSPPEEARARRQLAKQLLQRGDEPGAIEELMRALRLASENGLPKAAQVALLQDFGLANLRFGEVSNCVGHHRPGMCLLPIGKSGQHVDRRGSEAAMRAFAGVLAATPDHLEVEWLLNIAAMTLGHYPEQVPVAHRVPADALRSTYDIGRFPDVAHPVGLAIHDTAGGAVMDDFDGDGLYDIVTTAVEPCTPMRFFRYTAKGVFEDRGSASGLANQLGGSNLIHADVDNDGDRDLYVIRGGWFGATGRIRNSLLLNDGAGHFADVTRAAGLAEPAFPAQSAAFADYDGDGDLDLFVGNEGLDPDRPFPSQLFRNDGVDGTLTFTDVATPAGVRNERYAKGVAWGDYDNDGAPDLYISNLGPNRLYRNQGDGTFIDVAPRLGLTEPAGRSFPTWWFDVDNDGWLDLFVGAYSAPSAEIAAHFLDGRASDAHPRLYRNLGPGADGEVRFEEVSAAFGLEAPSLPMGANYGDLDNDGFLDFYLGTGIPPYEGLMPNLMYRNDGGRRFQDVTYSGGFGHLQKGHGVAFGDLDGDGDQDIFEQMGGVFAGDAYPSALYENPGHGHRWLQLDLVGAGSNRDGIGSRITLTVADAAGERRIHRQLSSGGSFGGSPLRLEIGLGATQAIRSLEVLWPATGRRQRFTDLELDRRYEIGEEAEKLQRREVRRAPFGGRH